MGIQERRKKNIVRARLRNQTLSVAPLHLGNIFPGESISGGYALSIVDNYNDRINFYSPRDKTREEIELKVSELLKTENWDWAGVPPE